MEKQTVKGVNKFFAAHIRKKRWHKAVTVLSCLVVFCTTYALILPAITMTGKPFCGKEEHVHTEACYLSEEETEQTAHEHTDKCYETQSVLICGQEEAQSHAHSEECYKDGELTCGLAEGEGHQHTEDCYEQQKVLVCSKQEEQSAKTEKKSSQPLCGKEEHEHSMQCYSDSSAVEEPAEWTKRIPKLTGDWAQDLVAVAKSQLGYTESETNFFVDQDNTLKGYTRYGAWYGGGNGSQSDYLDWDAMFVSFCMHYAGIPKEDTGDGVAVPQDQDCQDWVKQLRKAKRYQDASYSPKAGDLVFFDQDADGKADHVGIVESLSRDEQDRVTSLSVIEGDWEDKVAENTYHVSEKQIMGYCALPENPAQQADEDNSNTDNAYAPMAVDSKATAVDTCTVKLSLKLNRPQGMNDAVTVHLVNQTTGERVKTVTIAGNANTVSFDNLPRVDENGEDIPYGIELEKVSGYVGGYDINTTDSTNVWEENSTLWVKAEKIEAGKSYLLLTSDAVGPGNSRYIRANSTIIPKEMLSEDVALSAGPITAANGTAYSPYLKADADGIGGALWTAQKNNDGFSFYSNYLTENNKPGYYLDTANSLDNKDKVGTKWKFDTKNKTIKVGKDTLYPFEKVDPVYGSVRTVNMDVDITYTPIGQAEENWQEYTTVRVKKEWQDAQGKPLTTGLPESLQVTLQADGNTSSAQDAVVTLTAEKDWTYEWTVPRYSFDSGVKREITYSVKEEQPDGFTQGQTSSEDIFGDPITAWVLTDDFEDNTEYVITTSPATGTVDALTATSSGANWANGKQSKVNVKSGSLQVNGVNYSQYIQNPPDDVIWQTGKGETKTANQHGTHKMWTLYNAKVNGYLKNNGQGDISSDVKQECWFYYNWYTGTPGKRPPSNPSSEWSNVLGSYNDYFLLSNNHTGDGNATTAQTFWLYKKVEAQPVVHQITLVNSKQSSYELPETGGAGTYLFTIGGSLLMVGSLLYYGCMKYRKERRFTA